MKEARQLAIFLTVFLLFGILVFAQLPQSPPAPSSTVLPQSPTSPSSSTSGLPPEPCAPGAVCTSSSSSSSSGGSSGSGSSGSGIIGGSGSSSSCTVNDWSAVLSPTVCPVTGRQTKSWSKTRTCSGGVNHTAKENITCVYSASAAPVQSTAQKSVSGTQQTAQQSSSSAQSNLAEEKAQSASNTSFYIVTGVFAILFIVALVFAVLKLKKPKMQSQQINPQVMQLKSYISDNLRKGYTKEQITSVLIQAGYSQQIISEAMKFAP